MGAWGLIIASVAAGVVWLVVRPRAGRLLVVANTDGAQIAIRGASQLGCVAPCNLTLPAGGYHLIGTKPGYKLVERAAVVAAGEDRSVDLRFDPAGPAAPSGGHLAIAASVVGAQVLIDGRTQANCMTPCELDLPAGKYHVTGTKPGYGSAEQDVSLAASASSRVTLQLSRLASTSRTPTSAGVGPSGSAERVSARPAARLADVYFTPGNADTLDSGQLAVLHGDAQILKAFLQQNPRVTVRVEAHCKGGEVLGETPERGDYLISIQRAESVRDKLIEFGVPGVQLVTKGYGRNGQNCQASSADCRKTDNRVHFEPEQ